jgi:hypothetical protein
MNYTVRRPTWLTFMQGVRPFIGLHDTTDDSLDHEPSAEQRHPADEEALLAFSYKPSFDEEDGRPRFSLGPSWITDDESWPPPPSEVTGQVAAEWPILADLVTAAAPKGRLHALCFLRGGAERVRHGASAITAYLSAAQMAARKPEAIEYWRSGPRLARALRDVHAATRAQEGLLDFAENELSQSTKLGFAIQALEVAAAEPSCPARIDDLLEAVAQSATHVSVVDRALRIMLGRANPAAKPEIWRRRVEVHRVEALAADHPLVKSAKLQKALKLAQMSGLTELATRSLRTFRNAPIRTWE